MNIKSDSKSFYAYAKSKSKVKPSIGPLLNRSGETVSTERDMGELLSALFAPVFTEENATDLPDVKHCFLGSQHEKFSSYAITEEVVKKAAKI